MDNKKLPFDFNKIDTSGAHKYTNEQLLDKLKAIPIISSGCGGWGIIAEIAKRFQELNANN